MFFDKILDFLKLENLYKNSDFRVAKFANASEPEKNVQTENHACSDYNYAYEILSYWSQHHYSRSNYKYYRDPTYKEKSEYALIDILSCFSKGARGFDNFSPILLSNLGITNIQAYLKKLADKKYLIKADITETLVAIYNMKDLKIIADSLGLKKSGKKCELIQRIEKELSSQQIKQILKDNELYIISDKGKEKLTGNEDYIPLHRYLYLVSLAEFNDNRIPKGGNHPRNFYDTMFQVLSNQKFFYECRESFQDVGLTSLHIYNILIEEIKKTAHNVPLETILNNYIEHAYINSCFCFHITSALEYSIFSDSYSHYSLVGPDESLYMLKEQEPYINYDMLFIDKPPSFLTNDEFKEYIHEMLTSPIFDIQKWNFLVQKRIKDFDDILKYKL